MARTWCKGMSAIYKGRTCKIESIDEYRLPGDNEVFVVINTGHGIVHTMLSHLQPPGTGNTTTSMVHNPTFAPEEQPDINTYPSTDKPANGERVTSPSPSAGDAVYMCKLGLRHMLLPILLWCCVITAAFVADTSSCGAAALCSAASAFLTVPTVPTAWGVASIGGAMLALPFYLHVALDFAISALHVGWTDSFYNRPSRREWSAYVWAVRRMAAHSIGALTLCYLPQLHLIERHLVVFVWVMLLAYPYLQRDRTQASAAASNLPGAANRAESKRGWRYRQV